MKRRLFTLASAVSLVLCVALSALWVRSYWNVDCFRLIRSDEREFYTGDTRLLTGNGRLFLFHSKLDLPSPTAPGFLSNPLRPFAGEPRRRFRYLTATSTPWFPSIPPQSRGILGFRWEQGHGSVWIGAEGATEGMAGIFNGAWVKSMVFPIAAPVLATAVLPLSWVWRRWRNPPSEGRCVVCGYDLRATPDRCPECGTPVATTPSGTPGTSPSAPPSAERPVCPSEFPPNSAARRS